MRKKNGFTLVELLAVIVVLALIMIIAIPSVLDTMNTARRQSFVLYIEKIVNATQTSYVSDAQISIPGTGIFIYDINTDLGLTSTGSYEGYIVVDASDVDDPHYIVYLHDPNYMVLGFDVTQAGTFPSVESVQSYNANDAAAQMGNAVKVCRNWTQNPEATCMNRKNYVLTE